MRKTILTLGLLMAVMNADAWIRTITDGNFEFEIDDEKGTAKLTKVLDKSVATLEIPRIANEGQTKYMVNSLGNESLNGCSNLTELTVTDNITSIYKDAFSGCTSLTSIDFSPGTASLEILGTPGSDSNREVFEDSPLQKVSFSRRSSYWGIYTPFAQKETITEAFIGKEAVNVPQNMFKGCSNLKKAVLEEGLVSIDRHAFYGCTALADLELPSTVTEIGIFAFDGCSSLTSLELPLQLTSISSRMCNHCTSLLGITVPGMVRDIEDFAFYDCSAATSLSLPASLETIGEEAFRDCKKLGLITCSAVIPPAIERYTFRGVDKKACRLIVPEESVEAYRNDPYWREFFETGGITEPDTDKDGSEEIWIDIDGTVLPGKPEAGGIYIVRKGNKANKQAL